MVCYSAPVSNCLIWSVIWSGLIWEAVIPVSPLSVSGEADTRVLDRRPSFPDTGTSKLRDSLNNSEGDFHVALKACSGESLYLDQ